MLIDCSGLPTISQHPTADVVIYDGNCAICRSQSQRLAQLDGRQRLSFVSLHDRDVTRRWPDLTRESLMQELCVIDAGGQRHRGASALKYLTRRLPALWCLAPLLHLPFAMPTLNRAYTWFAKRRYGISRVMCDGDACELVG